jgi:hypothetical protein
MSEITQELVFEYLDTAVENGYPEIIQWSAFELTADLRTFTAQFEVSSQQEVLPFVEAWLRDKRKLTS